MANNLVNFPVTIEPLITQDAALLKGAVTWGRDIPAPVAIMRTDFYNNSEQPGVSADGDIQALRAQVTDAPSDLVFYITHCSCTLNMPDTAQAAALWEDYAAFFPGHYEQGDQRGWMRCELATGTTTWDTNAERLTRGCYPPMQQFPYQLLKPSRFATGATEDGAAEIQITCKTFDATAHTGTYISLRFEALGYPANAERLGAMFLPQLYYRVGNN